MDKTNRPRAGRSRIILALFLLSAIVAVGLRAGEAEAFAVGHTSVTYQDPARGNRSIPTEIYYPALTAGENVPVAEGLFPVVTFGHGFLLPYDIYSFVWNGLVPDGFIVALPRTEGSLTPSHGEFGKDLAFLVAKLRAEGANSGSLFYERVSDAAAVMGHSMGGGASFLAAAEDPTITALANFAAAETNPSAIAAAGSITVPSLLLAGSRDCVTPPSQHQIPMYDALASGCKTYVNITGASHCQFAAYNFTCSLGETGCPSPTITRAVQHGITIEYLSLWLDFHLKGNASSWIQFQDLLASDGRVTFLQECAITSVARGESGVPLSSRIDLAARPNPFNPSTTIVVSLPEKAAARLLVYDARGRAVRTLLAREIPAGITTIEWDGTDDGGAPLPSGTYFSRIETRDGARTVKLILVR